MCMMIEFSSYLRAPLVEDEVSVVLLMLRFGKVLHPASEAECKALYPGVLAVVPLLSLTDVEADIGATCRVAPRRAEEATV